MYRRLFILGLVLGGCVSAYIRDDLTLEGIITRFITGAFILLVWELWVLWRNNTPKAKAERAAAEEIRKLLYDD